MTKCEESSFALLEDKIRPPSMPAAALWRPRLSAFFAQTGTEAQVFLVRAPAGYGKTTLLSQWTARQNSQRRVAWLSFDAQDNSPARFLRYFAAACKQAGYPDLGIDALTKSLSTFNNGSDSEVLIAWIDRFIETINQAQNQFIFVLDNCDCILEESGTHDLLCYFLVHLPVNLQLFLLSRTHLTWGLKKWQLKELCASVDKNELAFTTDEIVEVFSRSRKVLSLTKAQAIKDFTRGWPASIRLLLLADISWEETNISFENNPSLQELLASYLFEEVFHGLSSEQRRFLLITAQMDLFCASMAEELTGLSHERVSYTIQELVKSGRFLDQVKQDSGESWFQYHPLLTMVLRHQILSTPEIELQKVLRMASLWFERNGKSNLSALYAKKTCDWNQITGLIERFWRQLFMDDNSHMVYRWAKMLPDEVLLGNPRICCIVSMASVFADDMAHFTMCSAIADAYYSSSSVEGYPEALALKAEVNCLIGKYEIARDSAEEALELLPASDYYLRFLVSQAQEIASFPMDWLRYRAATREHLPAIVAHGHLVFASNVTAVLGVAQSNLGNLTDALELVERATVLAGKNLNPLRSVSTAFHCPRMLAAYYRSKIGEAEQHLKQFQAASKEGFLPINLSIAHAYGALFQFFRGHFEEATTQLEKALRYSPYGLLVMIPPLDFIAFVKDRGTCDYGRLLKDTASDFGLCLEWRRLDFIVSLYSSGAERLAELQTAISTIEPERHLDLIYGYLLLALYEESSGNQTAAEIALIRSIEAAESEQITQLYSNEHRLLLPVLERMEPELPSGSFAHQVLIQLRLLATGEAALISEKDSPGLTARENDIAYLLVSGFKTMDIASRLSISKETVRRHIANIYHKLGVHSRTQLFLRLQ